MQDRVFYAICFGFIGGVLLRSFLFVDIYITALFGMVAFAILIFFTHVSKNNWGMITLVFVLAFCLGIFRYYMADVPAPEVFETKVGKNVYLQGIIIDEPSIGENSQKLSLEVIDNEEKIGILLSTGLDEDFKYGDAINFRGKLSKPENFVTDQGKQFDYINYLRKDGIFYVMSYPSIEMVSHGNGNRIKNGLFFVKEKFLEKINFAIKSPENLLMGGLILGEKSSFNQSLRQSFVNTGTIHIIALSGYNVTIVAEWFMKMFAFLPRNLGFGMGIFAILLFILMAGGSSTAIRAGIMASLALIARATDRDYDVARALVLAAIVMIILNPFVLAYDVSFQLSFIATVAVIFIAPRIEKYFRRIPERFGLRDIIAVTCAAYVFVLPFILYKMGSLSLVALPANILILPFIPFTMFLGFLTGLLGFIWYAFAVPAGYVSYFFLHYELSIVSLFSNLPFAALSIPNFPLVLTFVIYAYYIYRFFGISIRNFFKEN